MSFGLVFLIIGVGMIAAPWIADRLRKHVTSRPGIAGTRIALSQGATHIRESGDPDGPVIILIHGLTTPEYVWNDLRPGLDKLGYRVVSYDLYGRGYSDRPPGKQTRDFFLRQLEDVLDHLGGPKTVTLIGFSMGGAIATTFAATRPKRINRVALIAPAGLEHHQNRFALMVRDTPFLGDWLMGVGGSTVCRSGILGPSDQTEVSRRQRQEVKYRGFLPAVLSSQRNLLRQDLTEDHRAINAAKVPVLAIWGQEDTVIPINARGLLEHANPAAQHVVLNGADHRLPYTHPNDVFVPLRDFLKND